MEQNKYPEPHPMWLLCARARDNPDNMDLQMLVQALTELCTHREYSHMTPEQVYDFIKKHIEETPKI